MMTEPNLLNLIATDEWRAIDLIAAAKVLGGHPNRAGMMLRKAIGLPDPGMGPSAPRVGATFIDTLSSGDRVARCAAPFGDDYRIRYFWRMFPIGTTDAEILASAREGASPKATIFDPNAKAAPPKARRHRGLPVDQIRAGLTNLSDAGLLDLIEQTEAYLNAAHAERIARTMTARRMLATLTRTKKDA